jgi:hypothetical protein
MKAVLFLAFVASCLATRTCTDVPAGKGGTTPSEVLAFYKYSFEIPKDGTDNQLHLFMDMDDISIRQNQILWLRVTSDSTNANSVSLNVKIGLNQQSPETQANWFSGDLTSGSASNTITATQLGVTANSDRIWWDFYPSDCSICKSTIDFSVEVAWLDDNNPFTWGSVLMIDNIRTIVFDQVEGGYVNFYADFAANQQLWTSVVYPGTLDQNSEVVLYWQKDDAPTTQNYTDTYPIDGTEKGDYQTTRAFKATSAGTWWLSTYVKTQGGTSDPKFTIKVGFDDPPCAGAFTIRASSILLALIPLTLLFSRQ